MIFGVTKPKIYLLNGAGESDLDITFTVAPNKLEPSFIPDLIKQRGQDGSLTVINRGHWVEIDAYFPSITDAQFTTFIEILKQQFDFDPNEDYNQNRVRIYPHYTDYSEYYDGYITSPIDIINEFHFLTHGLKFKFEGRARLPLNTFLMSNQPGIIDGLESSVGRTTIGYAWTDPDPATGYLVIIKSGSAPTAGPVDGTVYAVSDTIGGGTVKKYGTGLTVSITGLTPSTHYYIDLYAYNGSVLNVKYSAKQSDDQTTTA
jgi:hypothetical protein